MRSSFEKGINAEAFARKTLIDIGYEFLFSRYKTSYGEIDLVMKKDKIIVLVEIKYRKFLNVCDEIISHKQVDRIFNSYFYLVSKNDSMKDLEVRFDAFIIYRGQDRRIYYKHIENAWQF